MKTVAIALALTTLSGCHRGESNAAKNNLGSGSDDRTNTIVYEPADAADNVQSDTSNQVDAAQGEVRQ